ncbi:MAG: DUF1028 domain-containing protein [Anaerolineales bacterium]
MTYSIVARDPSTGELGLAVQSRYFAAGLIVPWIEASVGAIASQSFVNPVYSYEGLRLLRTGRSPQEALEAVKADDPDEAIRQVGIVDAQGRLAAHTGARCVFAAGHAFGESCSAQANMMARPGVPEAMVTAFEAANGDLAEKLMRALEAAERAGGDVRGKQGAALIVVKATSSGVPKLDAVCDLRVDDHANPVGEVRRLLDYRRALQRVEAATDRLQQGGDPMQAMADLQTCLEAYPNEPEFLYRFALALAAGQQFEAARATMARAVAVNRGWAEFVLRFADAGLIPVTREALAPLVDGL